jgi:hypothetical protein
MLGARAPADIRRAVQRLRAEGAPALAVDDEITALAPGLATMEVSRSPGVLDALPPLFWLEARLDDSGRTQGWVMEKKQNGLAVRAFRIAAGTLAEPEVAGAAALAFGAVAREEDAEAQVVRGLVTAVGLPGMLAQMGESSPVLLMPADAPAPDAGALRGFRLSVAIPPDQAPG